jgi:hypothetical protein
LVEESWRRITSLQVVFAVLAGALAAGVLAAGLADLARATAAVEAQSAAGTAVFAAQDLQGEGLSARACAALENLGNVTAAGPSYGEDATAGAVQPGTRMPIPIWDLSLGALRAWWPDAPAAGGLFTGRDVARTLGLYPGQPIVVGGELAVIDGLQPESVVPGAVQASVVRVVVPTALAGQCWFRLERGGEWSAQELATAAFPDRQVVAKPFDEATALSTSPAQFLTGSATRQAWALAAAIAVAFLIVAGLAGRGETGVYRATGTKWPELMFMTACQAAVLVLVPAALATAAVFLAGAVLTDIPFSPAAVWFLAQPVVLFALAVFAAAPAATALASAGAVADRLKG